MRMITEKLKWRSSSKIEGIRIRKYREKKKKERNTEGEKEGVQSEKRKYLKRGGQK